MHSPIQIIGVNVFVFQNGKLLLGMRKNAMGDGDWGLPGGHLEHMEHLSEGVLRELKEETGLAPKSIEFLHMINDPRPEEGKHFIHIGFIAKDVEGEVELMEPEKCYEWKWFPLDALPENIFVGNQKSVAAFFANKTYVD